MLVDLANKARKEKGLPELTVNAALNKAAVFYSGVMIQEAAKAKKMMKDKDHTVHELGGTNIGQRLDKFGYDYADCGENVAVANKLTPDEMAVIHKNWMGSKYHRANILAFREIGVALVKHPKSNEWYATQAFGLKLTNEEQMFFNLMNMARQEKKLKGLVPSGLLINAANAHAANMAKQMKLEHKLDKKDCVQRIADWDYVAGTAGENIAQSPGLNSEGVFKQWLAADADRAHILGDKYEDVGIGWARDANGTYYYCQLFAAPKPAK
jgi:uncharacterized protein YkwD